MDSRSLAQRVLAGERRALARTISVVENGGQPEHLLGSADWMKRNLDGRVETILSVPDPDVQRQIDEILEVYVRDNASAWDCDADGVYRQRTPAEGEERCATQETFIEMARA